MMHPKLLATLLTISGLVAATIGAALLIAPVAFEASSGIELAADPSLLSELRAPGGALLALGLLILAGAFVPRLAFTSTLVSALLYLAYAGARGLGLLLDGRPADGLVVAMVVELGLGLACAYAATQQPGPTA